MNRAEHLAWCKMRALEYAHQGDTTSTLTSLVSDLGKHDDTKSSVRAISELGTMLAMTGHLSSSHDLVDFVNGVN